MQSDSYSINYIVTIYSVNFPNKAFFPLTHTFSSDMMEQAVLKICDPNFDSLEFLRNSSINNLPFEQKLALKSKIPKPNLVIIQKDGKVNRKFQISWYSKYKWLAGCAKSKTLRCYWCLMFSSDNEKPWCNREMAEIKNFQAKAMKHANSRHHIENAEKFFMLGKTRIDHSLSEARKSMALKHNNEVVKNRRILGRLIDVTCFLGNQELAFRGHDESKESHNKGNYRQLLDLLSMEEANIKDHLEKNSVFKGTSSDIQNDLISSVSSVVKQMIIEEIQTVSFVSIQADETTDVSVKAQLSIIIRYVYQDMVVERFLGFYDVSKDKTALGLSNVILRVIQEWNIDSQKVISQTYDGASVMAGPEGGVQCFVREKCPNALFFHCYAHNLNLVLLHCTKSITDVKLFICNITAFHTFFRRSSKRAELLREKGFKLPHPCETRWNYNSRAVYH